MNKITRHNIITMIPFLMLFITALSGYFSSYNTYSFFYSILGDLVGYSVLTNIVFIFLYFRKSFCSQTKIAVAGLLVMNIISIIFSLSENWVYNKMYDLWLSLIILVFIVLNTFNAVKAIKKIIRCF